MKNIFHISKHFTPAGDQPKAIKSLSTGLEKGFKYQTLLGVTGSGKTFTVANVIAKHQKPTLVIAHNKTLAAQLAQEYREFFPTAAVHYFVSYYDFYQPEAYIPHSDTYIEKDAQINAEIERLRHATTQALLSRKDVIIVASVSCIYGLGNPEEYEKVNLHLKKGEKLDRSLLMRKLIAIYFDRTSADLEPGTFRVVGGAVEVMPAGEEKIYRFSFNGGVVEIIEAIDPLTRIITDTPRDVFIFPAKHFVTPETERERSIADIKQELEEHLEKLKKEGKLLEAERIKRRTNYDIAMIREVGYCNGIENYSRHLSRRNAGEPPDTLLSYFPHNKDGSANFLTIIDESHVTIPQIGGMYEGDASRKRNLVAYGFRLPSALDNRPLRFKEFEERIGQVIYTSATPGTYEREKSTGKEGQIVEQVIRPTGLVDPILHMRPVVARPKDGFPGQIPDFIEEVKKILPKGFRALATTLTKRMAEDLSVYLKEQGIKSEYLHSEIKTLERIKILSEFRRGMFDVLVGVNLLREGLDLPEVSLIGILDADKEGFLRSETSLIQTIGRAARNSEGTVILYADHETGSMKRAISETLRRRNIQLTYNKEHGITPTTIQKKIKDITHELTREHHKTVATLLAIDMVAFTKNPKALIKEKERQMNDAVRELDFETAALLRDEIKALSEELQDEKKVD